MRFGKFKLNPLIMMKDGDIDDKGGGGGEDQWYTGLPTEVQTWDEVQKSEGPDQFWDQITNLRSAVGSSIRIPGKDAGEEDWTAFNTRLRERVPSLINKPDLEDANARAEFFQALGTPEKEDGYTLPEIEGVKNEGYKGFTSLAHKHNLTQEQFTGLVTDLFALQGTDTEQAKAEREADIASLQKEWGFAYDRNNKIVENFLLRSGAPNPVVEIFKAEDMDSASRKWFYELAQKLGGKENTHLTNETGHSETTMTPEEATIKISEIMNNKKHPYWNKQDPGHAAAQKLMRRLYELKLGKTAKDAAPSSTFQPQQ